MGQTDGDWPNLTVLKIETTNNASISYIAFLAAINWYPVYPGKYTNASRFYEWRPMVWLG